MWWVRRTERLASLGILRLWFAQMLVLDPRTPVDQDNSSTQG